MSPRNAADTPWPELNDAYGPADAIPALLKSAEQAPNDAAVWDELWSRLCHQGTIYPASVQALPYLAALTEKPGGAQALDLAADILTSQDPLALADQARTTHPDAVSNLEQAAIRALPEGDVHALWALAACRNAHPWQRFLADDALEFECPQCLYSWGLLVEEIQMADAPVTKVSDPEALALAHMCETVGNAELAALMYRLAGAMCCPNCGVRTPIADAVQM